MQLSNSIFNHKCEGYVEAFEADIPSWELASNSTLTLNDIVFPLLMVFSFLKLFFTVFFYCCAVCEHINNLAYIVKVYALMFKQDF
jgi:hypothetical protein